MQEHIYLSHVHNALEFADLREGAPYEVAFQGNTVNPLAHLAVDAAVKMANRTDCFIGELMEFSH